MSTRTGFLTLPLELVEDIISYLDGPDLVAIALSCKEFHKVILQRDVIWQKLAYERLSVTSCEPYRSSYELYSKIYPFIWLHNSVWFGDIVQFGSLFISKYNPHTGQISFYKMLRVGMTGAQNDDVQDPDMDRMITHQIKLMKASLFGPYLELGPSSLYDRDTGMWTYRRTEGAIFGVSRVAALRPERITRGMNVWPPFTISSKDRARNVSNNEFTGHFVPGSTPPSPNLFRLKKFPQYGSALASSLVTETFWKIDPELLYPTQEYPWRGIWMADIGSHGVEFLLLLQPSKNRLEGVKLTGGVSIPRGEYRFIVEDTSNTLPKEYHFWPEWSTIVEARIQHSGFQNRNRKY